MILIRVLNVLILIRIVCWVSIINM